MFITETHAFFRSRKGLLDHVELEKLKAALLINPETGVVIPGSKGLRKMRWAAKGHGKRGGARVIYYLRTSNGEILLLMAYAKNEREDLDQGEIKLLRQLVEELQ